MATKRARVTASQVIPLLELVWDGKAGGIVYDMPTIDEVGREGGYRFTAEYIDKVLYCLVRP